MACGKAADRERTVAERSPYGELEIARAEEAPDRIEAPARRPSSPSPPGPARKSSPAPSVPADTAPKGEPDPGHDTVDQVTFDLEASPIEPAGDTARPSRADTSAVPGDTVASPAPLPAAQLPSASPAGVVVPAGTVLHAALEDSIHSRLDVSGRVVTATVMQNLTGPDGRTLIPAGAPVLLTVTRVKAGRGDRKGLLEIRPDSITVAGEARRLEATLQPVPYELRGRGVTGEEAAKVGVGAAGGAVVGRVLGGNARGAVIGGVVGAAGGAVVASETAAKDVVVKARTPIALVLTAPVAVPPSSPLTP
jgi:hypothetical protein